MKLALISDLHFGSPTANLVENGQVTNRFHELVERVGADNDFLVLAGDVFDFSICPYEKVYAAATVFFAAVQEARLARDIVYLPGNHDGDFWHLLDYEINVIKKIRKGEAPRPLHRSLPAVIDDRAAVPLRGLFWPTIELDYHEEREREARDGLFLDRLFPRPASGHRPRIWVCYPNLYFASDHGPVLITHGHYYETFWALGAELALAIAGEGLGYEHDAPAPFRSYTDPDFGVYGSIEDTVGMNFPLNQFLCSGIGQATPLTKVLREIQHDAKENRAERIRDYLDRLPQALIDSFAIGSLSGLALKGLAELFERFMVDFITAFKDARNNANFLDDPAVQRRFGKYHLACLRELDTINQAGHFIQHPVAAPGRVIFGHTHVPTGWNKGQGLPFPRPIAGATVITHNSGGWLNECAPDPVAAEIFTYSTAAGWGSHLGK
jgi:hypothetical protein